MNQGIYPLSAAMINQINRLDVISNNLANVNTNGFKEEGVSEGTFNSYLQKAQEQNNYILHESSIKNNIPKIDEKYISSATGTIQTTGNALDFALTDKNTFFKIQNSNGEVMLSRDGAFKVDAQNMLVDSNGNYVLNNDNEAISAEDNFTSLISLNKSDFTNLEKFANNYYKVLEKNKIESLESNDGLVLQGSIEKSNVNMVSSMVSLIDAHRSFAQSQKAVSTIDEMNGKLIEKLGRMA